MRTLIKIIYLVFLVLELGCSEDNRFYVYSDTSNKTEVSCPTQDGTTAVFFTFGQSNSANYAERSFDNVDARIINYFRGKCYIAKDPLLGAMGSRGSTWIPMSEKLLADGTYTQIIIVASGIGGVKVEEINRDEEAHGIVKGALISASANYQITDFLYHQGESNKYSTESQYTIELRTMINWTTSFSPTARFFVSVASLCHSDPYLQVQNAQRAVVNNVSIFQGPDTDSIAPMSFRYDGCHLGIISQQLVGEEWGRLIE